MNISTAETRTGVSKLGLVIAQLELGGFIICQIFMFF